jgi:pyruvate/2-oxoglutarate/acetoin dehydrogenase E1 component
MPRVITYAQAILEAQDQLMSQDPGVFLIGLGVPTPTGVFGTTKNLVSKYGESRVLDIPASENALTGVALGASILGLKPIFIHHRVDFAVLSLEPIVNQAAKWHYMYGQTMTAPIVIRMIIGRGWGQGPQHSQSLQAWFAHIPGLKVLMPTTAKDAKQLLIAAVKDASPVIILEHRWLYDLTGDVPEELIAGKIGKANIMVSGTDLTLVSNSIMSIECVRAASKLLEYGISAEVIDLATIKPLDKETIISSVQKTKNVIVVDNGHLDFGVSAEVISIISENLFSDLKRPPLRIGLPNIPTPTSRTLADAFYPDSDTILTKALELFGKNQAITSPISDKNFKDVPNKDFKGPY